MILILVGCAGKAPPEPASNPDGGGGGDIDAAGSNATALAVSGTVADYFTTTALDTTIVQSDGIDPEVSDTTASDGSYTLTIATGSKLYLVTTRSAYHSTRNAATTVADMALTQDLFVLSEADVQRQYSSVGLTETATNGFIAAQLEKNDGTPLTGIALTAVVLLDPTNTPVTVGGPFFFGAVGDLDTTVTTSTDEGTRGARAGFLNVPPGPYTLAVTYLSGMGTPMTNNTPVLVAASGATLIQSGGLGAATTAPNPTNPSFATDIYPLLQTAAKGGLGCANCHTATGPTGANALPYDGDVTATLTLITTTTGVINLTTPATSLFLTMPLYETTPPQNHPNATFLDVNDPYYKLFLLWITQGTKP